MPRPTVFVAPEQRAEFAKWIEQERVSRGVSKGAIAAALGYDSIQHVNKVLSAETTAMPKTLRRVCKAIGTSWPQAIVMAGHIEEVLYHLASLKVLSDRWRREDEAYPPIEDHNQFRSIGVGTLKGVHILDAIRNDERLASRYIMGFWDEDHANIQFVGAPPPPMMQAFMQRPQLHGATFLPKPLALAIAIVAAGFPRRGDVWRNGCDTYAAFVLNRSAEMFELAESLRPKVLPPLLRQASDVLRDSAVQYGQRRIIASEYMSAWADAQNMKYTHVIRLGAYAVWGESGSRVSTVSPYTRLPDLRKAQLPKPSALALHATKWHAGVRFPKGMPSVA